MPAPPSVLVLRSEHFEAWVIPFGARLMQLFWLHAPQGPRPLSLGFSDPEAYRQDTMSIGAVCGRYGNRIGGAVLERGDKRYALDANHPLGHCIHGGTLGWGQRDWQIAQHDASGLTLTLDSADGDMGFAGRCQAQVQYRLEGDRLVWQADARVDAESPINLVQHSYWNLDGAATIDQHVLQVDADRYHPWMRKNCLCRRCRWTVAVLISAQARRWRPHACRIWMALWYYAAMPGQCALWPVYKPGGWRCRSVPTGLCCMCMPARVCARAARLWAWPMARARGYV